MSESQEKLTAAANVVTEIVADAIQAIWDQGLGEAQHIYRSRGRAAHPQYRQVFSLLLGRALLEQAVGFLLVGGSDKAAALTLLEESWAVMAECVAECLDEVSAVNSPGGDV